MGTRDDLVAAGVTLLERDGLNALSLRAIASESGVSHGAPRRYFPSYGTLLAAIARRGVEDLDVLLTPALADDDPASAMRRAAHCYVDFAFTRPEMFTLITRHALLDGEGGRLRDITQPWFARLAVLVREATGDDDPHRPPALWAGVHGVAVLFSRRADRAVTPQRLRPEATLEFLLDAVLRA